MATRTALQLITQAFRRLGLCSEDEAPTAEQGSQALEMMNDMMNGWEAEGIQYNHTDLGLQDTVNVPDALVTSTMWRLAEHVAMQYGKALSDTQAMKALDAKNALQAFYTPAPKAQTDPGVLSRRRFGTSSIRTLIN